MASDSRGDHGSRQHRTRSTSPPLSRTTLQARAGPIRSGPRLTQRGLLTPIQHQHIATSPQSHQHRPEHSQYQQTANRRFQAYHPLQSQASSSAPRSSHQGQQQPSSTSRPISHEESAYLQTLLATLNSPNALTIRALHNNESIPHCRQHVRQEISEFIRNTTSVRSADQQFFPAGTLFATTPTNLIEVCRKASGEQVARHRDNSISFATFLQREREAKARRERDRRRVLSAAESANDRDGKQSSVMDNGVLRSPLQDEDLRQADMLSASGKGKGKRKVRRKIWDDEDEGDILDALD